MNEILAAVVGVVFSEVSSQAQKVEENEDFEDELSPENIAHILHDEKHAWADVYAIYERILDLGIKDLYYKEIDESEKPS